MIKKEVKLETMLDSLIERGGYSRNRQPILDSINVTAAALSQYVRGRTRPSFDKLVALADFFGVSLDYLAYGEPTSTAIDHDPVARYVEQALMNVRGRTERHSDLVARIGRLLMERIDDVADEVLESRSAGVEGLIEAEEILRVERHCLQADIMTTDLEPNINLEGDQAIPGQFFPVVIDNLMRGVTYRFLLTGTLTTRSPAVTRLRELISDAVGGDRLHEYCSFRTSSWPVAGAAVLYRLDRSTFANKEPAIFTQVRNHLHEDTWLGYLNHPSKESNADMLMDPINVDRTLRAFDTLWNVATK
ncbi:helix-turn-helix transcriptional regulator [Actinophytocola sp.]|uniref:helix-turn-helix domain-containing protein n=1 Tax=Actinophytocola sp. TaxID=1872138 RepID=UPI002D4B0EE1|nr:helix-turn-helix transcriptional regulator [Actinophytocola sp.]HYQ69161.1 helix-turn-helix transcriptional regulator [Actinophytocola sp.]